MDETKVTTSRNNVVGESNSHADLIAISDDVLDTEDERDPTFNLDSSIKEDARSYDSCVFFGKHIDIGN